MPVPTPENAGNPAATAAAEQEGQAAASTAETSGAQPIDSRPRVVGGAQYGTPAAKAATSGPLSWMNTLSPIGVSYLSSLPNNPANAQDAATTVVEGMVAQGLPSDLASEMISFMTGQITGTGTSNGQPATADEATAAMYQAPFFKDRFPGIGQLGITPQQWVAQEQGYYQSAQAAGMPGFVTQADAAALIQGHVSQNELSERVTEAYNASKGADPNTLAALAGQGITPADVAKVFLDPDNQIPTLIQKVTTAQVAGVAKDQGFQGLTAAQAAQVASGVQASSGGQVAPMTLSDVQQNSGIQNAEMNESLTKAKGAAGTNDINTLSSATVLGAALKVGVGGLSVEQETNSVMGAIQTKAAASSGGGGFTQTKRGQGSGVGSGSEQGAEGDVMGGSS